MRALSAQDILHSWEAGLAQHPLDRALTLLVAVYPDQPRRALAQLSIGRRDEQLLALYEHTFGRQLAAQARCPRCQHQVEFELDAAALRSVLLGQVATLSPIPGEHPAEPLELEHEDYHIVFRLPNSLDLAAIALHQEVNAARQTLLARCLLQATRGDGEVKVNDLPPDILTRLAAEMSARDPQAEIELALICPHCEHTWQILFDIATFLWARIDAWARRLLQEVHRLAIAYGWREADILALSPARRQFYLEMVG